MPGGVFADGTVVTKPAELVEAELYLNILERFGGYTLQTLKQESAELGRLLLIETLGGSRDAEHSRDHHLGQEYGWPSDQ